MERLTPGLIAELACAAPDWDAFERDTTPLLMDAIGADTAFFSNSTRISPHVQGVITGLREEVEPLWPELAAASGPMLQLALERGGGTMIDSEVLGRKLERAPYYDVLMRPVRGRTTLIGVIASGGQFQHKIAIGRCQGSGAFTARHRALLGSLLPTMTLACSALRPLPGPALTAPRAAELRALLRTLTSREREVFDYLRLGYSNEQIGVALGTKARTVRNQLSRVYEKLGVANRSEAVGVRVELES